jgi:hypothetical protein
MLTGIHFLQTYRCVFECDHCFLYSGPHAPGTFTLAQIRRVLEEGEKIGSVEWIYFEGGEPFLYYPSTVEGIKLAKSKGFKVGVVTNAYWAVSDEDAEVWLKPLAEIGIDDLSVSDDAFHHDDVEHSPAKRVVEVGRKLGLPISAICIDKPFVEAKPGEGLEKGAPVIGGGAMFKGRAVDTLTEGLPRRPWEEMATCPHEELKNPSRVHVDSYGHVHMCQGVSMGNMWEVPLSKLVKEYDYTKHPICAPLVEGGPALLAKQYDVEHEETFVDECHLCFLVRKALVDRFPEQLAPRQVYNLE